MNASTVRFAPRGAALDLMKYRGREVLMSGAAGTGKSVACLMKIHLACMMTPKVRALIVRKTHASLTSSTLVTFKEKVAGEAIANGMMHFYGGSAQEPPAFRYNNGSTILVSGLDKSSRLLSTEFDIVFVDEAIEVTDEDLDTLITRLRNNVLSYQQLIMATNPGAPTHHLKRRCDDGRCLMLYSKHEDNPAYHDGTDWTPVGQQYLSGLDSLKGARYQRMRWGKWVAAEGQIFEDFDPSVHVIPKFKVPDEWPLYITIDFGFVNPFVAQWWRVDGDGRLYLTREIYHSKTLVEDHARRIVNVMNKYPREPKPYVIADHDAEDRATLVKHLGLYVNKAKKDVSRGLQATQKRFEIQADGRPRIFFFQDAVTYVDQELRNAGKPTSTIEEIPDYVWDNTGTKALKEAPLKINDHGCDAMRYMVARLDLVSRIRRRPGEPA
jgi:PBSX family phage terminase large subunit